MIFWNWSSYKLLVIPFFLSTWWRTTPSSSVKPHKTEAGGKDCTNCFKWRCTGCLQFFAIYFEPSTRRKQYKTCFSLSHSSSAFQDVSKRHIRMLYLSVTIKQYVANFSFWERFWLHVYKSEKTNIFLFCHCILNIQHQYFQHRANDHVYLVIYEFFPTWLVDW